MWEAVSSCSANAWHVSKSLEYQQPSWFLQSLFLSPCLYGSPFSALSCELQQEKKKTTASIRECAQLLLRERRRPGGLDWMDLAAALCCWCSSDWLQGGKRWRGKRGEQCSVLDAGKSQGYCRTGGDVVCQWQSTEGRKTCSFLNIQRFFSSSIPFPLLLEGTKTVPVHLPLTWYAVLMAMWLWCLGAWENGQKTRTLIQWV